MVKLENLKSLQIKEKNHRLHFNLDIKHVSGYKHADISNLNE